MSRPVFEPKAIDAQIAKMDPSLARKLWIGEFLSKTIEVYKARKELRDIASVIHAQSLPDRLSSSQWERLKQHQRDTLALDIRKKEFRETDPKKLYQGIAYQIIRDLLVRDKSIKSVLNIGCNYAYMDWLLAKEYPSVTFSGIDVNDDIPAINSDLSLPNTKFYSGYALEMLEQNIIGAELVYMSSTSTVIRNHELRKYLELIAKRSKYFLVSEPIWTLPGGEVVDPKTIHPLDSMPGFLQRDPLTGAYGYLCWIHNYHGMVENAGFDVIEYRCYRPEFTQLNWCVALGQNRKAELWA